MTGFILLHGVPIEDIADAGAIAVELQAAELGSCVTFSEILSKDSSRAAPVASPTSASPEATRDGVGGVRSAGATVRGWVLIAPTDETFGNTIDDLGLDAVEDLGDLATAGGDQSVPWFAEPTNGPAASSWLHVDETGVVAWEQRSTASQESEFPSEA